MWSRLSKRAQAPLLAAALLGLPAAQARADVVDASATTLLQGRQDPRDAAVHTVVPAFELVSINARDIKNPVFDDLNIVLSGWGGLTFGDPVDKELGSGDLDLGYVEGTAFKRRLKLRLGRQLVIGGAAQVMPLDGADVTVMPLEKLGVTLYGGQVVVPRFALPRGNAVGGARAFYRLTYETEFGASFIDVLEDGLQARRDVALDARYAPLNTLWFTGYGAMSTLEKRLSEANLTATWQPVALVQVTGDWARTAPDLFIPRSSIFSVFAEETHSEGGGSLTVNPVRALTLLGDYHAIKDDDGWGHRARGRVAYDFGVLRRSTLGVEGRLLRIPVNGYVEARVYGIQHLGQKLLATADADLYHFRDPVNGQKDSYYATLTLAYDFAPDWRAALTGGLGETPYLSRATQVIARLVWNPTFTFREVKP